MHIDYQYYYQEPTMHPHPPSSSFSSPKTIYLIRHAKSAYNAAQHSVQLQFPQKTDLELQQTAEYLDIKWNQPYQDCDIVKEEGQAQCVECRKKMANLPVDLVVVSPLRRALSTCALVFRDHENNPPIIVDPMFREIFESRCDIGSGLRQSMKDYPHFDYSLINNVDYWYVDCIKNEEAKANILNKIKSKDNPKEIHEEAQKLMLQYLQDIWERRKQDPKHKLEALSPVDLQKAKLKLLLQKYNSIAIVTHSQNIKSYTGIKPPNCSIMVYKPEYFDLPVDKVPHQYI